MIKENIKSVGADATVRPSSKARQNKGITLIALVITIIVMLILVAVTISMAVNGGLFDYAGKAVGETQNAIDKEQELGNGRINVGGVWYDDLEAYIDNKPSSDQEGSFLPYNLAEKDEDGFLTENATYTSGAYTAVIPTGFKVSEVEGEDAIETGLVIKDASDNEFVWIPVTTDLANSYSYADGYLEPTEVEEDEGKGYDFTSEYKTMVKSVNANNGFYIGRYETTTDTDSNIGSKYNTEILSSQSWYNLYEAQKTANIGGNGTNVQTAMIYGVLWDETMAFISQHDTNYDVNSPKSGFTHYFDGSVYYAGMFNTADIGLKIWGLSSSFAEWTQESYGSKERQPRGGSPAVFGPSKRFDSGYGFYTPTVGANIYISSRLVMYIL